MALTLEDWRGAARKFTFDGHTIACWLGGNTRTKPLLLIHGFPTSAYDWAPVWDGLGKARPLIAADMLGFGLSDKPKKGRSGDGYAIHDQADLQFALMKHLGIEEFDILAHDYGDSVAQEMLARDVETEGGRGIGKVVFLNGGLFPDQHRPRPIQKLGMSPVGPLVSMALNRARFGKSFSEVFGPNTQPSTQELDDYWWLITRKGGQRIFHKLLQYMDDRKQHEDRWVGALKMTQERIAYLNGALDPVSGRHSYESWRARVPGAKAHLLGNIGHYPQVEAPEETVAKTLEWLG